MTAPNPSSSSKVFLAYSDGDQTFDTWLTGLISALAGQSVPAASVRELASEVPLETIDPDSVPGFLQVEEPLVVFLPSPLYEQEVADHRSRPGFVHRNIRRWLFAKPDRFRRCLVVAPQLNPAGYPRGFDWLPARPGSQSDASPPAEVAEQIARFVSTGPDPALSHTEPLAPPGAGIEWSGGLEVLLTAAQWIADGGTGYRNLVTPEALLVALVHMGRSRPNDETSAAWLTALLSPDAQKRWPQMLRIRFPNWRHQEHKDTFAQGNALPTGLALPMVEFSQEALWTISWCLMLAERLEEPRPGMVHLMIALLHRDAPWTQTVSDTLDRIGLNPGELRARMESVVAEWDLGWDEVVWEEAMGSSRPFAGTVGSGVASGEPGTFASAAPATEEPIPPPANPSAPLPAGDNEPPPKNADPDARPNPPSAEAKARLTRPGRLPGRGTRPALRWLSAATAGYSNDAPRQLDDCLDITPDVEAFAKVLSSWSLRPPLALGLFGDWGSGKTFFMRSLRQRIEAMSAEARRSPKRQSELTQCKHVVQIEFNAWHYSEGDLWACLVDHLFTNLRLSDQEAESLVARRRKAVLAQIQAQRGVVGDAAARKVEAAKRVTDANDRVAAARKKLEEAQHRFTQASVQDIWDVVVRDPKLAEAVRHQLQALGFPGRNLASARDIEATIEDARSLGGQVKVLASILWREKTNLWAWVAFGLVVAVGPVLLALVMFAGQLFADPIQRISALVASALTFCTGAIPIYRTCAARVRSGLEQLDRPRRIAEDARRRELEMLQREIATLAEEQGEAERVSRAAEQQQKSLEEQLKDLNADKMLADFLEDRAATDDYRKKLGTLALIRRDFERLSELLETQRREQESGRDPTDGVAEELRINRIILYIDDLDRCRPSKVVDMLQAIHLLLAFPLFVVVVGVDARWVHRAIRRQYPLLLGLEATQDPNPDEQLGPIATPRDYLEKIFQVPFWLTPMTDRQCQLLMEQMVLPMKRQGAGTATDPAAGRPTDPATTGQPAVAADQPPRPNLETAPATPGPAAPPLTLSAAQPNLSPVDHGGDTPSRGPSPATPQPAAVAGPGAPERDESLEISPDELAAMQRLAPVVGRSPRAAKRFVNCYRLFKAVLPESKVAQFVGRPGGGPEQPASGAELAMIFLAIIIGAPSAGALVNETFQRLDDAEPLESIPEELESAAELAQSSGDADPALAWAYLRAAAALREFVNRAPLWTLSDARWIEARAWRFSFRSAMLASLPPPPLLPSSGEPPEPAADLAADLATDPGPDAAVPTP